MPPFLFVYTVVITTITTMTILINLTLATICFLDQCYPALVGKDTPLGEYQLIQRLTDSPGYGGDVLQFKETDNEVFAIHRTWILNRKQQREKRLTSTNPKDRMITSGCINVAPDVYERLVACCSNSKITIIK